MASASSIKTVSLVPMTDKDLDEYFIPGEISEYASFSIRVGAVKAEHANEYATAAVFRFFPKGKAPEIQRVFHIQNASGENVGYLWFMTDKADAKRLHLMDIKINEESRRRGYGKAALIALEKLVGTEGFSHITLNVMADNPAKRLYESVGFVIKSEQTRDGLTNYLMEKRSREHEIESGTSYQLGK